MPMFRKSVAGITASLSKMIDNLSAHAARQEAHADYKSQQIFDLTAMCRAHDEEARKAREVAGRIAALIG